MSDRIYFWQRDGAAFSAPVFGPAFGDMDAALEWQDGRGDEMLWFRLLSVEGCLVWNESSDGGPQALDAREAVEVIERAPVGDDRKQAVALWAAGVGRREISDAEVLMAQAALVLRMTRGVSK